MQAPPATGLDYDAHEGMGPVVEVGERRLGPSSSIRRRLGQLASCTITTVSAINGAIRGAYSSRPFLGDGRRGDAAGRL